MFEPTFYEAKSRAVKMARRVGGGTRRARPRGERIKASQRGKFEAAAERK